MTIDEAIKAYEYSAKFTWNGKPTATAEECQKMVEWLKELKAYREASSTKMSNIIFTGTRVHYELRNETHNYQMVTPFGNQNSQEGIRAWFKENYLSKNFPEGKYVIVKVTETEKVEVVEELEVVPNESVRD